MKASSLIRKEKIAFLQGLQKGRNTLADMIPTIHITLIYTPKGNMAIISNPDPLKQSAYKTFTESNKDLLIDKIKERYRGFRIEVDSIPVEEYNRKTAELEAMY